MILTPTKNSWHNFVQKVPRDMSTLPFYLFSGRTRSRVDIMMDLNSGEGRLCNSVKIDEANETRLFGELERKDDPFADVVSNS